MGEIVDASIHDSNVTIVPDETWLGGHRGAYISHTYDLIWATYTV